MTRVESFFERHPALFGIACYGVVALMLVLGWS